MRFSYLAASVLAAPALGEPIPQTASVKPWIADYDVSDICFPGQKEECQGSLVYCGTGSWKDKGEPKQYKNLGECLSERTTNGSPNGPPGGKIPFLEASGVDCLRIGNPETCTGSAEFCAESGDEAACLAARTAPPENLPFFERGKCRLQTERCIGTKNWCRQGSESERKKCEQRRNAERN